MKVTYGQLNHTAIVKTLQALRRVKMPARTSLNVFKITQKLELEEHTLRNLFIAKLRDVCNLDENGQPKIVEGKWDIKSKELSDELDAHMNELMQQEFEVEAAPLHIAEIPHVEFSMEDLAALAPVLYDIKLTDMPKGDVLPSLPSDAAPVTPEALPLAPVNGLVGEQSEEVAKAI